MSKNLPAIGSRVGRICGPWGFPASDDAGTVAEIKTDEWYTYAVVKMDDGSEQQCMGLTKTGIGWYALPDLAKYGPGAQSVVFDDGDVYVVKTSASVRIGEWQDTKAFAFPGAQISCGFSVDVPNGHAWYDRVAESTSYAEVRGYLDELKAAMA